MDTSSHYRLNQRPDVFIFDCALPRKIIIGESRPIRPERHRLILQVTLTALIANRTIQRMIHQQKFHNTLACFLRQSRVSLDSPTLKNIHKNFNFNPITMIEPFITGIAQAAIGFGDFSTSTRHILQFPAMAKRS